MDFSNRPRIGVLLSDLSASHLSWAVINSANKLAEKGQVDVCLFYEAALRPCTHVKVASMPVVNAVGFRGVLVATNLATAMRLSGLPSASRKLYYCWDLDWLRLSPEAKVFEQIMPVYRSAAYELVARTPEHAKLLSQTWNRPVRDVVPDANVEGLLGVGMNG